MKVIGQFTCPHDDGDFELTVTDLETWATGLCQIRQEGQGQVHDIALTKLEALKLAGMLIAFGGS